MVPVRTGKALLRNREKELFSGRSVDVILGPFLRAVYVITSIGTLQNAYPRFRSKRAEKGSFWPRAGLGRCQHEVEMATCATVLQSEWPHVPATTPPRIHFLKTRKKTILTVLFHSQTGPFQNLLKEKEI